MQITFSDAVQSHADTMFSDADDVFCMVCAIYFLPFFFAAAFLVGLGGHFRDAALMILAGAD